MWHNTAQLSNCLERKQIWSIAYVKCFARRLSPWSYWNATAWLTNQLDSLGLGVCFCFVLIFEETLYMYTHSWSLSPCREQSTFTMNMWCWSGGLAVGSFLSVFPGSRGSSVVECQTSVWTVTAWSPGRSGRRIFRVGAKMVAVLGSISHLTTR